MEYVKQQLDQIEHLDQDDIKQLCMLIQATWERKNNKAITYKN